MLKVSNVASIRPQFDVRIHFKKGRHDRRDDVRQERRIMNTRTLNVSL